VDEQEIELKRHRHANLLGLPDRGVRGDHDLTEQRGRRRALQIERDDVGRAARAEVAPMKPANLAVIHDGYMQLSILVAECGEGTASDCPEPGKRHSNAALPILNADAQA
jgi:hypothetical protein